MAQSATLPANSTLVTQCRALQEMDLSTLQDAPTQLTASQWIERSGDLPEYCKVEGYVAPQVGFEIRLPTSSWNRKLIELGNTGWGGTLERDQCDSYLKRGYACIVFDTGHKGRHDDGLWASHNLAAQIDFGYRATHVTALAGKAVVQRLYARLPEHSYFQGYSTGGYEGLVEAQRFPWDFDGIIAGAPDMDEFAYAMRALWVHKNVLDPKGQRLFSAEDLALLHRAVLDRCDLDDGVADGIIGDPLHCAVDLAKLLCKAAKNASCLTQPQVDAARSIYAGPTTSAGARLSTGGPLPGSELLWNNFADPGLITFIDNLLNHMIYGVSPDWKGSDFDFDRDYQRAGLAALYTDTNPDLRKFQIAGGKLLAYQGANDLTNLPGGIVDYYKLAEQVMGGRAPTQEFFRLFLVPGMNHVTGGPGAYAIDYLSYLEAWVEQRRPPEVLTGAHVSEAYLMTVPIDWSDPEPLTPDLRLLIAPSRLQFPLDPKVPINFTRPTFPFPDIAKYKGNGDKNAADNFKRRSAPPGSTP